MTFIFKNKSYSSSAVNYFYNINPNIFELYFKHIYFTLTTFSCRRDFDYKKLLLIFKSYLYIYSANADLICKNKVTAILSASPLPFGFKEILSILPKDGVYIISGKVAISFVLTEDDKNKVESFVNNGYLISSLQEVLTLHSINRIPKHSFNFVNKTVSIDTVLRLSCKPDVHCLDELKHFSLHSRLEIIEPKMSHIYSFILGLFTNDSEFNTFEKLCNLVYFVNEIDIDNFKLYVLDLANFIYKVSIERANPSITQLDDQDLQSERVVAVKNSPSIHRSETHSSRRQLNVPKSRNYHTSLNGNNKTKDVIIPLSIDNKRFTIVGPKSMKTILSSFARFLRTSSFEKFLNRNN